MKSSALRLGEGSRPWLFAFYGLALALFAAADRLEPKPDNILLDQNEEPVLIDFGAARESATRVSRVLSKILTVKDGYSPQEFYLAGSDQQFSSDLYALAATFYHLVSGSPPPSSNLRMSAAAKNTKDPLEPLALDTPGYDRYWFDTAEFSLEKA